MKRLQDILVFSHLRWNFVYQRPQHLLSRLKSGRRVIFVEEPVPDDVAEPVFRISQPEQDLFVCTPAVPREAQAYDLSPAFGDLLERLRPRNYAVWFYTPMAVPLASALNPRVTIYDCMDELANFKDAPPELAAREADLLDRADLVFTGGVSLYRAKQPLHPRVHCFPSSVDRAHFGRALTSAGHPLQANLGHPRFGFFGVIDERLDRDLLRAIAEAHPKWEIVMVGPVAKIDPAELPHAPNVHYFGQQPYTELPDFLSGWDVCLMPFARNDSTRFISPTKTLEYMAAEKMIVSTPIADVAEPYGKIVFLGGTPQEFIAACERALEITAGEREQRIAAMRDVLSRTSWDETASRMERLIETTAARGRENRHSAPHAVGTVVIGAGPTGLSAAYHLQKDYALIERNDVAGGWCRSIQKDGFIFDYVGHIMFSNEPYVHRMYRTLLGDNVHWQDREAWIFSKGVYTRYPFQQALHGLPPQVIKECITGAIEARFGSVRRAPAERNGDQCGVKDCCGDGILEAAANLSAPLRSEPANFLEFIYKVWGKGIAKHFAIPYNRKLWAVPLAEMETSWLGGRVPMPDLDEMIEGALSPAAKPVGPNARFGYPLRGGFQSLMNGFLPHLRGELHLNADVASISPRRRIARLADGRAFRYDRLISTMPLPAMIYAMGNEVPAGVRDAAAGLRHTSVRGVHLGIGRENITEKHWIYYPEETVFHRAFIQGNASPYCNRPGGFGLTFEITYGPRKPLPCEGDDLTELCIRDAKRVGLIREDDPVWTTAQVDLPFAYVVYDHGRAERVKVIRDWLRAHGIILAGRYAEWEYYNSDHAFIAGKKAAEAVHLELECEQDDHADSPGAMPSQLSA